MVDNNEFILESQFRPTEQRLDEIVASLPLIIENLTEEELKDFQEM